MSREGLRCRAQAQARFVEEAVAQGAGLYLLGCPLVVLFSESTRGSAASPRARSPEREPGVPGAAPAR